MFLGNSEQGIKTLLLSLQFEQICVDVGHELMEVHFRLFLDRQVVVKHVR